MEEAAIFSIIVNGLIRAVPVYVNPVSYTHLRAHETVLDLVCRLLLEKKKKKHMKEIRLLRIDT